MKAYGQNICLESIKQQTFERPYLEYACFSYKNLAKHAKSKAKGMAKRNQQCVKQ